MNSIEDRVKEILLSLIDMTNQHCQVEFKEDGAILDTMALSSNEDACFLLAELGLAKEINGRKYKLLDTKENIDKVILSLFPKPLSESEVEKVLINTIKEFNSLAINEEVELPSKQKFIAKAICSHFSKPSLSVEEIEKIVDKWDNYTENTLDKTDRRNNKIAIAIHKAQNI